MTRKETDGFWWKSGPRYVSVKIRVRIGLAQGLAPRGCTAVLRKGRRATRNLFSNIILRRQRPWRRYALY